MLPRDAPHFMEVGHARVSADASLGGVDGGRRRGAEAVRRHWKASEVHPMQSERSRFQHVARHLYVRREQWEQVVPNLGDALERAWKAGCAEALLAAPHPDCDLALPACRAHVLQDHDVFLAPAYMGEVTRGEQLGQAGELLDRDKGPGWAFVGERGVMVIVREVGHDRRPEVKSAYRIVPPRGRRPEDFLKAARRKLSDKTSWKECP